MVKLRKLFLLLVLGIYALPVLATSEYKELVETVLKKVSPNINVTDLQIDPINETDLLRVMAGADVFYVSKNGKYFFYGDLLDVRAANQKDWNLTELAKRKVRKSALTKLSVKDLIVFRPKRHTKKSIGSVTVFTDLDCPYGNRFYKESEKAVEAGLEIRYALFPRAGIGSESYKKAVSVWCSKDHNKAFSMANNGESVPDKTCKNNPIENQYNFGRQIGINATPSIVLNNGVVIPGFVNADTLISLVKDADASFSS